MKQILQNLQNGNIEIADIPCPALKSEHLLINTTWSLISAGTEKMLLEFGKAGWINKARQQPDTVRQVLNKIKTDGFFPTLDAVRSKLGQPLPLGYASVGVVTSAAVSSWPGIPMRPGDRVVSNGFHAEATCVSKNLCARVPDRVSDREAVFTVPGAIALQGIRLAKPEIGEIFCVTGLGLLGLLTIQLLAANGCRVIGLDPDLNRCKLALKLGAADAFFADTDEVESRMNDLTTGRGVDAVIITAATSSNEPVHQAASICRKRGRIVLVGVAGLELQRADFYEKELSFQVSCSYGPGRYDPLYETKGHDYPYGYVRWTEQRNFEAVLEMIRSGKLDMQALITHEFPIEEAVAAYDLISLQTEPYLGVLFKYSDSNRDGNGAISIHKPHKGRSKSSSPGVEPVVGMIGAGGFADQVLLPAIQQTGIRLKSIASQAGVTGTHLGRKYGFETSVTDNRQILEDADINTVFISTRHNTHAELVMEALKTGKHVFVEKPLCIRPDELAEIENVYQQRHTGATGGGPLLMVGYNRRFAPQVLRAARLLKADQAPLSITMLVNAGSIPAEHWTQDPDIGGGRIIGEVCHFIDLLRFLAGSRIREHQIVKLEADTADTVCIQLLFQDGSIGSIQYFANGHKAIPKERLEIYCNGKAIQIDNFRMMRGYGFRDFRKLKLGRQDKGHNAEVKAFIDAISSGQESPIPFEQIVETTRISFELAD